MLSLWIEALGGNTYPNYALAFVVVFFYIPFVLVVVLYSIILMKLNMQVHPGEQLPNAEEQRNKRNRNVLKMAIAIVVVFFICFIPFFSNFLIVSLSNRAVPFCFPVVFVYTTLSPFTCPSQTLLSTPLSASFLAVIIAKHLRDL